MLFYEDFKAGDVDHFGRYEVTREEIIEFAGKYDPQPFHLSDEGAKNSLFGKLCASGWHSCAMTMRMMVDEMMARQVASLGSPGLENLRWPRPVFPGDVLSLKRELLDGRVSQSKPGIGLVRFHATTLNQKDEPVVDFTGTLMLLRRNPG